MFPFETAGIEDDATLRDLREREPVCKVKLRTGGEAWLVTRYADVRRIESDPRFSRAEATKPGTPTVWPDFQIPQGLVYLDEPDHSRVRKVVAAAFSPRRIEQLAPLVQGMVDDLLDEIERHGPPRDFFMDFGYTLPLLVIAEVLGMPPTEKDQFRAWMNIVQDSEQPPHLVGQAYGEVYGYLAALTAYKKAKPGDDALTALLQAEQLSDDELLHNVQNLVFAGQDVTANMVANSIITLLRHPDQLFLLRKEPQRVPQAVEELLRYLPSLVASPARVATVDVQLGDVTIRKGDAVLTIGRSANRDERAFQDPHTFDVTRNPAHLTFGYGPHFCLGASLARLELTIALRSVIQRFPDLRLADTRLEWLPNRIVYTVRELQLLW